MKKTIAGMAAGLLLILGLPLLAALSIGPGALNVGSAQIGGLAQTTREAQPVSRIPPTMLALYRDGLSQLPGVHAGQNEAGAEGPMQFEPATFARYGRPVPAGGIAPPNPYDPVDAVYAAARMLCADGGASASGLGQAVFDYNHSGAYVTEVLALAGSYGFGSVDLGGLGPDAAG
jgi:hypothetical protein